jgi:cystathionine gamma-synthase
VSESELLSVPIAGGDALGRRIPDTTHAVSVALPRWRDVVGYEEHLPEVIARLQGGYPRFVVHPLVRELVDRFPQEGVCLPFPSANAAAQGAAYVRRMAREPASVEPETGFTLVRTTSAGQAALQGFWQHTGMIVSSRQAETLLAGGREDASAPEIRRSLRRQLAAWYDVEEDDVFLTPTGMAAQFLALQAVNLWRPQLPTAQLGFPYVDTFKLQQRLGHGGRLLHRLASVSDELRALLHRQPLAASFGEIPGNPLLGSADVRQVAPVLREFGVPLVVDDVVATPYNIDLRPHADLIATSLTKFVAGTGDVMGGALICNPRASFHAELKPMVQARHEDLLWGGDALVLDRQARTFPERMRRHNENGLLIAERLRRHGRVERVWYPKWEFWEAYESVRRPNGGWGALITFLLKDAEHRAARVYDALVVCKGPSLGTVFTLACPFTLLAHYSELEWAESCGVSRYLIRLSIGLENPEDLWQRLETALEA